MIKIYKITSPSNKNYIGQTGLSLNSRISGHKNKNSSCTKLKNAIKKYGWENFKTEIVDEVSEAIGDCIESFMIQYCDTIKNGYNLETGGHKNKHHSEETRKKISENSGATRPEVRKRISESLKGRKQPPRSEEWKREKSKSLIGRKLSEETRRKISNSHRGKKRLNISGENHPFYGKKRPEFAEKMKGRKRPEISGENSPTKRPEVRKKISESMIKRWSKIK